MKKNCAISLLVTILFTSCSLPDFVEGVNFCLDNATNDTVFLEYGDSGDISSVYAITPYQKFSIKCVAPCVVDIANPEKVIDYIYLKYKGVEYEFNADDIKSAIYDVNYVKDKHFNETDADLRHIYLGYKFVMTDEWFESCRE